jgi:predicted nucleic acid-binding protein
MSTPLAENTTPFCITRGNGQMEHAFVDTSAWFAYANRHDPDHTPIRNALQTFQGRLITSNFIFDETVTLCLYRLGHQVAATVGEVLLDPTVVDLIRLTPEDEQRAWTLFLARPDKTYSYTNCTSFVLMRHLKLQQAIALDTDFQREGFLLLPTP